MKKVAILAGILALVFCVSVLAGAGETVLAQSHGCGHDGKGFWSNLTTEQREAIHNKIKEMKNQGADPQEIHTTVTEILKGYGIEVPEDWSGPHGRGGFGPGPGGFCENLTEEQRESVRNKIEEMRSQGATREEIHTAVTEMLKGYGVEVPEEWKGPHGPGGFGPGPGGFFKDLTEEQRKAVKAKIKEMRSQNSKPEEIHTAVTEMLKGYGIKVPEKGWGHFGFGRMGGSWGANLTDEQRVAVRDKIKEMRSQGAKREEIRTAIDEMIRGFSIQAPDNSEKLSSVTASGENGIIAQSYPNPFNPETNIAYTLNAPANVRIQIYNVTGQLIRTFDVGYQPAGNYSVHWDGRNENEETIASGVYLYRIEAGSYTVTNRMVLLK